MPRHRKALAASPIVADPPAPIVPEIVLPKQSIADSECEFWFAMEIHERKIRFVFTSPEVLKRIDDEDEEGWAVTIADEGIVAFADVLKADIPHLQVIVFHELFHLALSAPRSGEPVVMSILGAKTHKQAVDREEAVACYYSNNIASAGFAAGIFVLPPIPGVPKLPKVKRTKA